MQASYKNISEISELTPELFKDIIIYTIAEPGAMGNPYAMEFVGLKSKFIIFFENIPFSAIKEAFPAASLKDCYFNGPCPGEDPESGEIVIYPDNNNHNQATRVAKGWHHIYAGAGNHIVIKEEYYPVFAKYISEYKSPVDIYCNWDNRIDDFINEISGQ